MKKLLTKRMISLHNTSDEYHTANEESFNVTANNSMNNSVIQPNTNTLNNVPPGGNTTPATTTGPTTMAARKQMVPLDQNEPAKPLSAYALFFRDTVSAIKQQNPSCSFQELSKIVASMWDALDPVHKGVYNKKNELAKIEYLKQMRIYQQQQQLKQEQLATNANETIPTDTNVQPQSTSQQVTPTPAATSTNAQQNTEVINNNNIANTTNPTPATSASVNSGAPSDEQISLLTEAGAVQKCTRENCNKRAIINPDWEDEYCSNECVVIHCRNVFNTWVQSNLEAKQQQQQTTTQQTTTT
ncbi:TOX high mobility group box family member 4 isoform X2 [Calliphora vicina]|uniref:TOX high mobility group box family member 4 isoform X2 n=1 Tax=Calliphora vicina TaxID=7373 RepID=UPI00325BF07D